MNLGEKIKELRLKNNMTQDDLALKCYVTRNAVSKWENDKGYPNIESIKLLCKCFNITIDELLNDEINEHAVKELTVEVIKNDLKLAKNLDIIVGVIVALFYFMLQIGLRELIFYNDPTAGLGWGLIMAPFCSVILGVIGSILIRRQYVNYLSGFIGLLISIFFDTVITEGFTPVAFHIIYYGLFLFFSMSAYSIKYQRFMFIPLGIKRLINKIIEVNIKVKLKIKTKIIIDSCILGLTFTWFNIELILSIIREFKDIPHPVLFDVLHGVPLLYIILFIVPLTFQAIHLFVLLKKEKPIYDSSKVNILNIMSSLTPAVFIVISMLPLFMYNGIREIYVKPRSVFYILNKWSIIPIFIYMYSIISSLVAMRLKCKRTLQILNFIISTICFILTLIISIVIWNNIVC